MFEKLVEDFFDDPEGDVAKSLLHELEGVGRDLAAKKVAETAGRVIVKGIDEVVAAAVKVLDEVESGEFGEHYVDVVDGEFVELLDAIKQYVPLQVAVESAKLKFGKNSAEANAARQKRAAGIAEVKGEVADIFSSVTGGTPKD